MFYLNASWLDAYNVYFIVNHLDLDETEVAGVLQIGRIVAYIFQLPIVLCVGLIYDIWGRKKPFLLAWIMASVGLFVSPLISNKYLYYVT